MATTAGTRNRIDQLPRQMAAQWSTVRASDGRKGSPQQKFTSGGEPLPTQMHKAQWPTPTSLSFKDSHQPGNSASMNRMLALGAGTELTGPTPSGSNATTAKRVVPNPVFACWLMGFPDEWICGALLAMQSFRKSRRK